ncbi:MAG: ribonuclease III [Lachnospiraceae bacterium]|nr:ribonuclease III [Lachnospiraceae bacterium]MDE6129381.1 ribonuclease III [Lachnospiraceae bacterium]
MEESVNVLDKIKEAFAVEETDIRSYSPLTFAYVGDAVYDLIIRTVVVERANRSANALHKKTSSIVKAKTQSDMIEAVLLHLTEEEKEIYKRGRNAKPHTMAKNASVSDYRRATGFEALIGYLYLTGNFDRILVLVKEGLAALDIAL